MPANFEIVIVLAYLSRAVALYHQHISILPKSIEDSMHDHLMTTLISAVEISIIEGSVRGKANIQLPVSTARLSAFSTLPSLHLEI